MQSPIDNLLKDIEKVLEGEATVVLAGEVMIHAIGAGLIVVILGEEFYLFQRAAPGPGTPAADPGSC